LGPDRIIMYGVCQQQFCQQRGGQSCTHMAEPAGNPPAGDACRQLRRHRLGRAARSCPSRARPVCVSPHQTHHTRTPAQTPAQQRPVLPGSAPLPGSWSFASSIWTRFVDVLTLWVATPSWRRSSRCGPAGRHRPPAERRTPCKTASPGCRAPQNLKLRMNGQGQRPGGVRQSWHRTHARVARPHSRLARRGRAALTAVEPARGRRSMSPTPP
jgi:hypothetical protein